MMNGDYSSLIEHFKPQLLETLGQEYKALLQVKPILFFQ
jgi:crotonobetainyl-CoA:carnitine CoA-transferase CaiB-like acyl-CoA transferase